MKILILIGKIFLGLVVIVVLAVTVRSTMDARIDYDVSIAGVSIPQYTAVDIPFDQENLFTTAHPFAAGAIIDIDNDGVEELFLGGGPGQSDALLRYADGAFEMIANAAGIEKPDGTASFGASVIDTDGDGFDDLLVSRTDGVWLHRNHGGTFSAVKLSFHPSNHQPLQ